jgi:putative transcriptional regulator
MASVIMKRTAKHKAKIDWSRVDAMTEAERHAAAMAGPDARPMTDEEWDRAPRVPLVSIVRRALKLSQEQFAATFHIPLERFGIGSKVATSPMRRGALICA